MIIFYGSVFFIWLIFRGCKMKLNSVIQKFQPINNWKQLKKKNFLEILVWVPSWLWPHRYNPAYDEKMNSLLNTKSSDTQNTIYLANNEVDIPGGKGVLEHHWVYICLQITFEPLNKFFSYNKLKNPLPPQALLNISKQKKSKSNVFPIFCKIECIG